MHSIYCWKVREIALAYYLTNGGIQTSLTRKEALLFVAGLLSTPAKCYNSPLSLHGHTEDVIMHC